MKHEKQINVKLTNKEFEIVEILKSKYAVNISQLIKISLAKTLLRLENEELSK